MTKPPPQPKLYHITHIDNLAGIVTEGAISSDAGLMDRGGPCQPIGMSEIKRRRIEELEVSCHSGTRVGEYVPFCFCPRSVMLYVIHCANHPELAYRGGQEPIVHLETDLWTVIRWADRNRVRWAFSLSNAGARYAEFRANVQDLDQLDWAAIDATDFRHPDVKERKQAEFLVYGNFPFDLIERIGVRTAAVKSRALEALGGRHSLQVEVLPQWYF